MKKWDKSQLSDFLEEERLNCYWFWLKGKLKKERDKETLIITETILKPGEWNGIRFKNGFFNLFEKLENMAGVYNGQTKQEYQKNFTS